VHNFSFNFLYEFVLLGAVGKVHPPEGLLNVEVVFFAGEVHEVFVNWIELVDRQGHPSVLEGAVDADLFHESKGKPYFAFLLYFPLHVKYPDFKWDKKDHRHAEQNDGWDLGFRLGLLDVVGMHHIFLVVIVLGVAH